MTEDFVFIPRSEEIPSQSDFSLFITDSAMEPLIRQGSRVCVSSREPLNELDIGIFYYRGKVLCRRWCEDYNGALILLGGDETTPDNSVYLNREERKKCLCLGKVII